MHIYIYYANIIKKIFVVGLMSLSYFYELNKTKIILLVLNIHSNFVDHKFNTTTLNCKDKCLQSCFDTLTLIVKDR